MWNLKNEKYVISYSFLDVSECSNGTAKYIVSQQQQFNKKDISYVYIFRQAKNIKGINLVNRYCVIIDNQFVGAFSIYDIQREILKVNKKHNLTAIFIHHLLFSKIKDVAGLMEFLNPVPIYFFVHDFATICSNFVLLYNDNISCAKRKLESNLCKVCKYGGSKEQELKEVKKFFVNFYERIKGVVCPSESAKEIWISAYPEYKEKVMVVPHLILENTKIKRKKDNYDIIRVAFLGRAIDYKGWAVWKKLVEKMESDSQLEFYVLGNQEVTEPNMIYRNVSVTDECLTAMTDAIIDNNIDITFLWSTCSETYSYTCMETLEAGACVVTFKDSGNIADVVKKQDCGKVFEDVDKMLDFFDIGGRRELELLLRKHYSSENAFIKESKTNDYFYSKINCEKVILKNKKPKYRKYLALYDKFFIFMWDIKKKIERL